MAGMSISHGDARLVTRHAIIQYQLVTTTVPVVGSVAEQQCHESSSQDVIHPYRICSHTEIEHQQKSTNTEWTSRLQQ